MKNIKRIFTFIAIIFFLLGWFSYKYIDTITPIKQKTTLLQKIKNKKRLDVVILNSPSIYYLTSTKESGFEYDLIKDYAKSMNLDLNLSVVTTVEEALEMSKKNIADITVAGISVTNTRKHEFLFGPQYYQVKELLVCNQKMIQKDKFPRDIQDMLGLNILIAKDTSYENTLNELSKELDGFSFKTSSKLSTENLLKMVYEEKIDCTLSDSNIYKLNQRYYPELKSAFDLSEYRGLAWVLRKGDNSLKDSLYKWLNSYEREGKMYVLKDYYFSHLTLFDYFDTKVFHKRIKNRLPKYMDYFKGASEKYNIPWILLAAQSYQESHWNPKAKSYTGVRGMMMLTLSTAKQMGIKNRLHPKSSIYAGAKYLQTLEKRLADDIKGSNRWLFALAAYNIGMGHLHDAQILARRLNKNPYIWSDIKNVLPLLSQKKYYKTLKYRYARGSEPVRYVDAIKRYANILQNIN